MRGEPGFLMAGMAVRENPKGLRGEAQLHNGIPPPVALGKSPGLSELHF